ncbi:unnamed protein product [Blepharisma stoltei]|uniref:CABIT domain-containing protein n=1 Tax=Blepharisma stoltei TaxID=1481888 RepID=A0AAU9JHI4_9CILI|nr:unnamed protein product [Blepharisma stoltei]
MSEKPFKGFTYGKVKEKSNQPKVQLEFMNLLLEIVSKLPQKISLNIPETIIYGCGNQDPHMIFTNDLGHLISIKASKTSLIHRFFKRCYYMKRNPFPAIIYKYDKGSLMDSCKAMMSAKEGLKLWKTKITAQEPILIQRYIPPCAMYTSKVRVFYAPAKGVVQCKLMRNRVSINGEVLNSVRGTPKSKRFIVLEDENQQSVSNDEKFLVKKSEFLAIDESEIPSNSSINSQLESLKMIIEKANLYGKINVLEILADFIQDCDENWYFINMIGAKTEKLISRISPAFYRENKHSKSISTEAPSKYSLPTKTSSPLIILNSSPPTKTPGVRINQNLSLIAGRRSLMTNPSFANHKRTPESTPIAKKRKSHSFTNLSAEIIKESLLQKSSVSVLKNEIIKDLSFLSKNRSFSCLPSKHRKQATRNTIAKSHKARTLSKSFEALC